MTLVDGEYRTDGERRVNGARRANGRTPEQGAAEAEDDTVAVTAEAFVIGPDGERMTRDDLPEANTRRWVPRRKARIVAAVEGGLVSREWALERYMLTPEEFDSWRAAMSRFGMRGLCVTKIHKRRSTSR